MNTAKDLLCRLTAISQETSAATRRLLALVAADQISPQTPPVRRLKVLVPAAGQGSRLRAGYDVPKPLVRVAGRTMLSRVLDQVCHLDSHAIVLVRPEQAGLVSKAMSDEGHAPVLLPSDQPGIGDAVLAIREELGSLDGDLLVVWTDAVSLTKELVALSLAFHQQLMSIEAMRHVMTFPTLRTWALPFYVQIIKEEPGSLWAVDCLMAREGDAKDSRFEPEQDCDLFLFDMQALFEQLPVVRETLLRDSPSRAKEFNLLHLIRSFYGAGKRVAGIPMALPSEVQGVNSPQDVPIKEALLAAREDSLVSHIAALLQQHSSYEMPERMLFERLLRYSNLEQLDPGVRGILLQVMKK